MHAKLLRLLDTLLTRRAGGTPGAAVANPAAVYVVGDQGLGIALVGSEVRLWSDTGQRMDFGTPERSVIGIQYVLPVSAVVSLWYRAGAGNHGEDLLNITYRVVKGGRDVGSATKAAGFRTTKQQTDAQHLVARLAAVTDLTVHGTSGLGPARRVQRNVYE